MTDPTEPSSFPGSADALRAQPTVPSAELARVLAALEVDAYGKPNKVGLCADAARLLREKASRLADIERQVRERCAIVCTPGMYIGKRHAPECMLVDLGFTEAK